jgi:hypothetical protein
MRKENTIKQTAESDFRPKLRLSEVERMIREQRILIPPPSRSTLITLCEQGVLEAAGGAASPFGWLVFEDSFFEWAKNLDKRDDQS